MTVPKLNLKSMAVEDLVSLRDRIQAALAAKIDEARSGLQKQMDALTKLVDGTASPDTKAAAPGPRRGRRPKAAGVSPIKGRKVEPKYRGPAGETWTGRGNTPRWLVALESEGKKREGYLIKK